MTSKRTVLILILGVTLVASEFVGRQLGGRETLAQPAAHNRHCDPGVVCTELGC
jgi:hypothetical protein